MSRKVILLLSILAVILAAGIILYSGRLSERLYALFPSEAEVPQVQVATVDQVVGQVSIRRPDTSDWEDLPTGENLSIPLYSYDRLIVNRRSSATLSFASNDQLTLLEATHALVEAWDSLRPNGPFYLNIVQGDYQFLKKGRPGQLYILMNGSLFTPAHRPEKASEIITIDQLPDDLSSVIVKNETGLKVPTETNQQANENKNSKSVPSSDGETTLSNEYMEKVISAERIHFQRCQANALRERGKAEGSILIGMMIAPSGRAENVKVLQSNLSSKSFEDCVISVFKRVRFNRFNGPSIARSYPLDFK